MNWLRTYDYLPQYNYVSTNQHGDRYKCTGSKRISVAKLSCDCSNIHDMRTLILLSHHLNMPVRYDFNKDPQEAFVQVVGLEDLRD